MKRRFGFVLGVGVQSPSAVGKAAPRFSMNCRRLAAAAARNEA